MITIWLNHWFSTAYSIIELIKDGVPDCHIICSNEHDYSPIRAVADEWYTEPVLSRKDYVEYCLKFCETHDVDVFMPRRHMVEISKAKSRFESAGIRVMVDDYKSVSVLNDKALTYKALARNEVNGIPDYRIATTVDGFLRSYRELSASYRHVCFKAARDEGGKTYRRIDNHAQGYDALFRKQTSRITLEAAVSALSERDSFSPIIVMPYLPDEEVSVDCLSLRGKTIAIPRVKPPGRIEEVRFEQDTIDACNNLIKLFDLKNPCNVQFKYLNGKPYLLEINTRMSGGVHMSCLAAGINIPALAVCNLLGLSCNYEITKRNTVVTQIEIPILLDKERD